MPTAGEEGYEKLVICPYDKSHEIRQGRMQFHLDKCRKNFPDLTKRKIRCPFNSIHLIYKEEEAYHIEHECANRKSWDTFSHDTGEECSVKNLVPVNAATVPDGDENWDNYVATGSVLETIKSEAAEKNIFRMLQCESKAKRKQFRRNEAIRHGSMGVRQTQSEPEKPVETGPVARPTRVTSIPVERKQNPQEAEALLNKQFQSLNINKRNEVRNDQVSTGTNRTAATSPTSFISDSSVSETASFATAASSFTPISFASAASKSRATPDTAPGGSTRSRQSTAMNIAQSARNVRKPFEDDTFCQMPIPGLGRGRGKI